MFLSKNPFFKLLVPLIIGILIQWYWQPSLAMGLTILLLFLASAIFFQTLPLSYRYRFSWLFTVLICVSITGLGMTLVYVKDIRKQTNWVGNNYNGTKQVIAVAIQKPLVAKERSYKTEARINFILNGNIKEAVKGNLILYFKKEDANAQLKPGDVLLFAKTLQPITSSGNPGSFNYARYTLFNKITHQVYLTQEDYNKLSEKKISKVNVFLNQCRGFVINTIKKYINGKMEQGLAEAMLIGYKDDLDKNLLQSYTNTGVVHVIAVSGMHLALLYWLVNILLLPLQKRKSTSWLHLVLVLIIIWGFTLLTGGAASIARAAVMFTFIVVGKFLNKRTSSYNMLAASAFFLLCYNPFLLWDIGFQLSYAAVLSIITFYKPVYNLLFVENKILNWFWQLVAVSIAAQILTTPLTVYHFHQFPVYFLMANLVAVPASVFILIATLVLVIVSPVKLLATFTGALLNGVIWWLNTFIQIIEKLPFALVQGIQLSTLQVILMFLFIACISKWIWSKATGWLMATLTCLLGFIILNFIDSYKTAAQKKVIVYNVPRHQAIDFINGHTYTFIGSRELMNQNNVTDFYITPSRVLHRVANNQTRNGLIKQYNAISFYNKKLLLINSSIVKNHILQKMKVDIVILSGNPRLYISDLLEAINPGMIVIDSSVPAWKAKYWVTDCKKMGIQCHNTTLDGAFVLNLH